MERRRAGETSGGPDMRFRAFVAVVCVASVGTLLRSMGTIRHDEQLEEAETRSPPVVRVVVMADTHGHHRELSVPDGHLLVHAGDVSLFGNVSHTDDFNHWLAMLPHAHKVVVAGNHDAHVGGSPSSVLAPAAAAAALRIRLPAATVLSDQGAALLGMSIWGAPWQSQYPDTGFYLPADSAELAGKWALVPKGVDLLVTHTPPSGACDVETWAASSHPRGCRLLAAAVAVTRPALLACGHLHSARGVASLNTTVVVNAAVVDDPTQPAVAGPVVFDCRRRPSAAFRTHAHLPSTRHKSKRNERRNFDCAVVTEEQLAYATRGELDPAHPAV